MVTHIVDSFSVCFQKGSLFMYYTKHSWFPFLIYLVYFVCSEPLALKQLEALYIGRTYHAWKEPEVGNTTVTPVWCTPYIMKQRPQVKCSLSRRSKSTIQNVELICCSIKTIVYFSLYLWYFTRQQLLMVDMKLDGLFDHIVSKICW